MFIRNCWGVRPGISRSPESFPVTVTLPARFDFMGGWTDTPPYFFDREACVLNATLAFGKSGGDHSASSPAAISVTVEPAARLTVIENGVVFPDPAGHLVLAKTLEFLSLTNPPLSISIRNAIPHGSGLGGSSLLTESILCALDVYFNGTDSLDSRLCRLVNNVLFIEQMMESGGGWQDQIGGLFPGVKCISTVPSRPCEYRIDYLETGAAALSERSLVIDTRVLRKAAKILTSIRGKYLDRDQAVLDMLASIARNARTGFGLLAAGDIRSFAELLTESWESVNRVESGSIEVVERLRVLCGNDLMGLKIGGAGGGGFILAIFVDPEKKNYHRARLGRLFPDCIPYDPVFGGEGLAVNRHTPDGSLPAPVFRAGRISDLECGVHRMVTK